MESRRLSLFVVQLMICSSFLILLIATALTAVLLFYFKSGQRKSNEKRWKKETSTHDFIVSRVRAFWSCSCFPLTDLIRIRQKIKFCMCTWGRAIWEALKNKAAINMNACVLAKKTNKKYQIKCGL